MQRRCTQHRIDPHSFVVKRLPFCVQAKTPFCTSSAAPQARHFDAGALIAQRYRTALLKSYAACAIPTIVITTR